MNSAPPAPLSLATALGYVSLWVGGTQVTSLTFNGPSSALDQYQNSIVVTVRLELPSTAPAGFYGYKILTTGWSGAPTNPANDGAFINASATLAGTPLPPVVTITTPPNTPAPGSIITVNSLPTTVTVAYTATSSGAGATNITASDVDVDGTATTPGISTGLNSLSFSSTSTASISTPGRHVVTARATNGGGTATTINTFFVSLNVAGGHPPRAAITVGRASSDSLPIGYDAGGARPTLAFEFTGTSDSDSGNVTGLTATIANSAGVKSIPYTPNPALGTAAFITASTAGLDASLTADGVNTVTVTATNTYGTSNVDTSTFDIGPRPTATITAPSADSVILYTGTTRPPISVSFQGSSALSNIKSLTATINGTPIVFTSSVPYDTALNVIGSATLPSALTRDGANTLEVIAENRYGFSVKATRSFTLLNKVPLNGTVFLDMNSDGDKDTAEFGIGAVAVTLRDKVTNAVVASTTTAPDGSYAFSAPVGSFVVAVAAIPAMTLTTGNNWPIQLSAGPLSASSFQIQDTGFALNFAAISPLKANGFTIGYWKNNIDKNLAGAGGTQVSLANLQKFTATINGLGLPVYSDLTMPAASAIMGSTSSNPVDLLAKQLVGSEYNFANSAFIGGSEALTRAFIGWGEYVLTNPSLYTSTYIIWAKSWFDAYNNTHGGTVSGPAATTGTTTTASTSTIRILVKPRATLDDVSTQAIIEAHGGKQKAKVPQLNIHVVEVAESDAADILDDLNYDDDIDFAEPDFIATASLTPNDPYFTSGNEWHLTKIQATSAWDITTGSASVTIAVVDSGANASHPDLKNKLLAGYNFVANSTNTADDNGHGTAVTGVVAAATNNSAGIAGVVWSNPILPVKVLDATGSGTYSAIANGITYAADHGAKIINLSLGGTSASSTLQNAVNYAWSKGCIVVAAAGNNANSTPVYPAACTNVVAVSSTTSSDTLSATSNFGSYITVAAPGDSIYSLSGSNSYAYFSGTSFASPVASGVVALIASTNTSLSNTQVVNLLTGNSDDLGTAGYDASYGYGRVNAYRAATAAKATVVADTTAPIATISSPVNGATVSGTINVAASATDNVGVTKLELYVDSVFVTSSAAAPATFSLNTINYANGNHTLAVWAYDAAGNIGKTSISVTVQNADKTPPTATITSPANGATITVATLSVNVTGTDNVGVTKLSLYVDGKLYASATGSSAVFSVAMSKLVKGAHTLQAYAYDAAGNSGASSVVTIYK